MNESRNNRILVAIAAGMVGLLIFSVALSYADRVITLAFNPDAANEAPADTGSFSLGSSTKYGSASLAAQFGDAVKSIFDRIFSSRTIEVSPDK